MADEKDKTEVVEEENPTPQNPTEGGTPEEEGENKNGKNKNEDNKNEDNKLDTVKDIVQEIMPGVTSVADAIKMQDVTLTLKEVSAPTKMGEEAFHQMESLNMSKLIGAPIDAAVEAHYNAAKKMLGCINEIGVKDGTVAVVTFTFFKNGKMAKMTIPLLTLVPITAMRIKEMTYDFKIKITTDSSINLTTGAESSFTYGAGINNASNGQAKKEQAEAKENKENKENKEVKDEKKEVKTEGKQTEKSDDASISNAVKNAVKVEPTFSATFSSKKDSKATQNSKYSVESSMDIGLTVVSDDNLPGGISKMLEILNSAINVYNPNGELTVGTTEAQLSDGLAAVNVSYVDSDGSVSPEKIKCSFIGTKENPPTVQILNGGDSVQLVFNEAGNYKVTADKLEKMIKIVK